ncbi:hypothetical protein B0H34DRAFT_427935 [Crassisporium funariophilum]|nr:hypothetical protein B0H34DRAFT_427935 [Crassisporium funariophilum]
MPTYSPLPGLLPYHRTEAMSKDRSALNPINATNTISYFYFYSTLGGLGLQLHCGHIFELRIGILRSWYRRRRQDRAAVHLVRSSIRLALFTYTWSMLRFIFHYTVYSKATIGSQYMVPSHIAVLHALHAIDTVRASHSATTS